MQNVLSKFSIAFALLFIALYFPAVHASAGFSYDDLASALNSVNERGFVDYKALKTNRQPLDQFVASLSSVKKSEVVSWTESQQMAFWINAYNALTLQTVINAYPDIGGSLFYPAGIRTISGAWSRKHKVASEEVTIPDIEHEHLRKDFTDPHIHLAIVCAAYSCPPLRNEPFLPAKLQQQFAEQKEKFVNSKEGVQIDRNKKKVRVSRIFKWFKKDFKKGVPQPEEGFGSVKGSERAIMVFIYPALSKEDQVFVRDGNYDVDYMDYEWDLNDISNQNLDK